jgi:hypothetical protein
MRKHGLILVCSLMGALLTACADEDAQTPPVAPTYVTNTTYNNVITYNAPAPSSTFAAPSTSSALPDPPNATPEVPLDAPIIGAPRDGSNAEAPPIDITHRNRESTGIAECDVYLDRVETCSAAMLSAANQSGALDRIIFSLDTARRSWRHAAQTKSERPELARTCVDALTLYNSSAKAACDAP